MRKLPPDSPRWRRLLTVPNVLSTIALIVVLVTGTTVAFAAIKRPAPLVVTGLHVKNNSLAGIDVKDGSLGSTKFTAATKTALAVKGDPGNPGDNGPQGLQGDKGKTGDAGVPAPRAFTFQLAERGSRIGDAQVNPTATDFATFDCSDAIGDDLIGCTNGAGVPIRFPRWNYWCQSLGDSINKHCRTTNLSVPQLSRTFQTLLVTANNANGGLLDVPFDSATLVLNATATFYTQRSVTNQRLECQLQIARVENGVTLPAVNVGLPIVQHRVASRTNRNQRDRLINIGTSGSIAVTRGVFETFLACRAPDDDLQQGNRLEFIEGNISVLSTRTNGNS